MVLFGDGCSECSTKNCISCAGKECCQNLHHFWDGKECKTPSEQFGEGCLETDGEKCTKCTDVSCCGVNQYVDLKAFTCQNCTLFDAMCTKCSAAGCLECGEGRIVNNEGKCKNCVEEYGQGCITCNDTTCVVTDVGFVVVGKVSKQCSALFGEKCNKCNASGCETCSEGEPYLGCKTCSSVFGSGCSTCDADKCITHDSECKLIGNVCVDEKDYCPTAYGEGCKKCDFQSPKCDMVDTGYFVGRGRSINCSVLPTAELRTKCMNGASGRRTVLSVRGCQKDMISVEFDGEQCLECSAVVPHCASCVDSGEGLVTCAVCSEGYVLYGGICKKCDSIHGDNCEKCSLSQCTERECAEGEVSFSGVCNKCNDVNPRCRVCTAADYCTTCNEGFIPSEGSCVVSCQSVFGSGCSECTATECTSCMTTECAANMKCNEGLQPIVDVNDGRVKCGSCSELLDNCASCSPTQCLNCTIGLALESGVCKSCSDLFYGCSECDSDKCTKCAQDGWVLTQNGCFYDDEPGPKPSASSSGTSSTSSTSRSQSVPNDSSSVDNGGLSGGAIAGIVIGVVFAVAIVCVSIFFVYIFVFKHGRLFGPAIKDEDPEAVGSSCHLSIEPR